ncbi:hypothetical protein O181_039995 [Austropuccinia psidii MF-1]|uniref:Uncharacterized protein n=1 Tax=Austropuccinia psidii MF-1 TaxID=1389203 RepID=A0A9Q3DCG0_9BASI|nr:hypothetical protein [Austropuccinia psidii MF-1]
MLGPFRHPTCGLWYQLGPFWPNSNDAKRGQGGRSVGPPENVWAKILKLAQGLKTLNLAIPTIAYGKNKRPPDTFNNGVSPQDQGTPWPKPARTKLVHISYYIPLFTIFPQQSNGDGFRAQLCLSKSSRQIHHPFQR